jgi:hypothetical protein
VTLETVVVAHLDGASPEQIVEQYPSVDLASVYGVLTYYLSHCDEVHHNLEEQDEAHRLIKRANVFWHDGEMETARSDRLPGSVLKWLSNGEDP